jgi:chemotaxis response regulator CheB
MPKAAIDLGNAMHTLSLEGIAELLTRMTSTDGSHTLGART